MSTKQRPTSRPATRPPNANEKPHNKRSRDAEPERSPRDGQNRESFDSEAVNVQKKEQQNTVHDGEPAVIEAATPHTPSTQMKSTIKPGHKASPQLDPLEVFASRHSIALARSQRLIQSWLPPKPTTTDVPGLAAEGNDGDDDFQGEDELAGVGSKRKADDSSEGVLAGLKRRKTAGTDKLLEQLLGRKGARAHRETVSGKVGLEQGMTRKKEVKRVEVEESDEEEGRAAVFMSKKARPAKVVESTRVEDEMDDSIAVATPMSQDDEEDATERLTSPPTKKAKPNSYLDELLGQKAAKKKKSKKKKKTQASAADQT
jgi:hypothetical protein